MGNRFEVWAWVKNPDPSEPGIGYGLNWYYDIVPCHQSLLGALLAGWRTRRSGVGCVRIEWR